MYQLIIADDETKIRTLLSQIIDWKSIGFEIAAVCSDGSEVIEYINHHHIDCILCDIRMTRVSGIDIAKYVYDNIPRIKVMLISGYQNFDYATSALSYNVENYFLKPVKIEEIKNAFIIAREKLDNEKNNSEIISCYRRDILNNLINGVYKNNSSISAAFSKIHLKISPEDACAVLKIRFKNHIDTDESTMPNFFQNMTTFKKTSVNAFYLHANHQSVKYILFSNKKSESLFINFANDLCANITEFTRVHCEISSFTYFNSVLSLCESVISTNTQKKYDLDKQEKLLISAVNSGNTDEMREIISVLNAHMSSSNVIEVKEYFKKLIESAYRKLPNIIHDNSDKTDINEYFKKIEQCTDIPEIFLQAEEFFTAVSNSMKDLDAQKKNILRIRDYIMEHCTENLSLEHVAAMAYLTPTWFSKVFKNIVGQTYIDFLISCKINKAKDLLINTRLKIYEISDSIGYKNTRSFTKLFNATCGMSPTEYRNKFAKDVY